MKTVIHKSETRGRADHGWLKANHTFSFAQYYRPDREHFGALRVLNDDHVAAGMGFGMHPHNNMEIVTIPLEGDLEHKDSMGNTGIIRKNDVQIMSAGTGIYHSEINKNKDKDVKLLQIWVFPKQENIKPRYDQITYKQEDRINKFQRLVSPEDDGSMWINQDAYFSLGHLTKGQQLPYKVNLKGNGVYVFVIEGDITVNENRLNRRDGMGIWEVDELSITANEEAEVLLIEVPMDY